MRKSYRNITTATTTVVKEAPGELCRLVVNKPINAGTVTIYDNTAGSGTKIGTITHSGAVPYEIEFDLRFQTGLTIVTSGADDITVVYE